MQYKGYKGGVEPMEKIAVLIPCYNEEKTIKKVVRDWKKELPEATIYVYNNNSTDRTAEIAKEAGVSTGIVYHYFKDKKAILLAAVDQMLPKFDVDMINQLH